MQGDYIVRNPFRQTTRLGVVPPSKGSFFRSALGYRSARQIFFVGKSLWKPMSTLTYSCKLLSAAFAIGPVP